MKKALSLLIFLCVFSVIAYAQGSTATVSGVLVGGNNTPLAGVRLTITPLSADGILVSSAAYYSTTSGVDGVITFSAIQGARVNIKGNALQFTGVGKDVTIPNSSTATIEELQTPAVIGMTIKEEGTALASRIYTLNFIGSGITAVQTASGAASVTVTGGGGSSVWGGITGTLSAQTDLQSALDAKQAADADLTTIGGLSPSNDDIIQRKAGAWTNRTPAQIKTDLVLVKADVGLGNVSNSLQLVAANNLSDLVAPATARTNLGLGTLATQSGTFSGTSSGTNSGDQDLSGLMVKASNLSDLANAGTARTNLGLAIGTNVQAQNTDLAAIAALTPTNDDVLQRKAGVWANRTIAQLKTDLSLSGTNTGDQTTVSGNAGSATILATTRAIYGNNFDGSAALAGIIGSTFGGTGNGFTKFSGATSSEKTYALPDASATLFTNLSKWDAVNAGGFAADAGSNDTYVATLSPAITAYVTGVHYRFKAATANTGAATLNLNALGAITIVKVAGGITTTLADNDIRAGQWVDLIYDGTNFQMQSLLGNAGGGTFTNPGGSSSERFGASAAATGSFASAFGASAAANSDQTVAVGWNAIINGADTGATLVGAGSSISASSGAAIVIGNAAGGGTGNTTGANSISMGIGSIAFTANTMVVGSGTQAINVLYGGKGEKHATPVAFTISGTHGLGTDIAGADAVTQGGAGTGTGAGGNFIVKVAPPSTTSATRNAEVTALTISPNLNAIFNGYAADSGRKRAAAQFDKVNTTLADVTGLSVNVLAGLTYSFEAVLHVTADVVGGSKFAIGGTATATSIVYEVVMIDNTTNALTITSRQTALAGAVGQAGTISGFARIRGLITVNAAGTLTVQFAENAAAGTSSVLVGSDFIVQLNP